MTWQSGLIMVSFVQEATLYITFGLAHTVEKSAAILVKMLSMSSTKLQTISPANFRLLAKDFNVVLPEKFYLIIKYCLD